MLFELFFLVLSGRALILILQKKPSGRRPFPVEEYSNFALNSSAWEFSKRVGVQVSRLGEI